jgi:hypothetical protein
MSIVLSVAFTGGKLIPKPIPYEARLVNYQHEGTEQISSALLPLS